MASFFKVISWYNMVARAPAIIVVFQGPWGELKAQFPAPFKKPLRSCIQLLAFIPYWLSLVSRALGNVDL